MAAANADLTVDVPFAVENFFLAKNTTADIKGATQLLSSAGVPCKGLRLISFTTAIASVAANITALQEFSVTDANSLIRVAVGDAFIPFLPALAPGSGAGAVNAGLGLLPAKAVTIDKVPVVVINATAGALDPNDTLTLTYLWLKLA